MGTIDHVTREFMKNNYVFAEVYNTLLGKKIVDPEKLSFVDIEELYLPDVLEDDTDTDIQRFRDVMKEYGVAMADERMSYVLLGVENQTKIDYSMAVRILIYDAMRYFKQLLLIESMHRKERDYGKNGDEFTGGFHKNDRIKPVVTVIVYYGSKPWDASYDLLGLFDKGYEEFRPLMNNYQIKVLEASKMSESDLEKLETDLRYVMKFIRYSHHGEEIKRVLEEDEGFKHLDRIAACVISSVAGVEIDIDKSGGKVDMCRAIQNIEKKAETRGIAIGETRGIAIGETRGIAIGETRGIAIGETRGIAIGETRGIAAEKMRMAKNMLKKGKDTIEYISEITELPLEEVKELMKSINP